MFNKVLLVVLFGEMFIHTPIKVANKAILFHYCVIEQMCKLKECGRLLTCVQIVHRNNK